MIFYLNFANRIGFQKNTYFPSLIPDPILVLNDLKTYFYENNSS